MLTYLAVFVIACVATLILVPVVSALASRLGAMDVPGELATRTQPAPRTGGLAIFTGFLVAVAYGWQSGVLQSDPPLLLVGVLVGGALIAVTGFLSDVKRLSFLPGLLFQFLAASVAVGLGVRVGFLPLIGLDLTLTLFYMVGCTNAINRLDAVDGLAGGVSTAAALGLGAVAAIQGNELVVTLAMALAGAGLGFLPFNLSRARVLLGDGGSLPLGFTLAACAVLLTDRPYDLLRFAVPLAVLGVPVLGLILAGVRRLRRRDGFFSTDRAYPYDLLVRRLGTWRAIAATWGAALFLGSAAAAAAWIGGLWGMTLVILALGIILRLARTSGVLASLTSPPASDETRASLAQAVVRVYRRYLRPVLLDLVVVAIAFYVALVLRFSPELAGDIVHLVNYADRLTGLIFFVAFAYVASGSIFGLYSRLWRYASSQEVLSILGTGGLGTLVVLIVDLLWIGQRPIPLSIVLMGGLLSTTGFVALRYRQRLISEALRQLGLEIDAGQQRTLIVGAGDEGQLLARRMQRRDGHYVPVGFVDDNQEKIGLQIHGIPVLGTIAQIPELAAPRQVGLIVIAMPGVGRKRLNEIFDVCQESSARIQIVPDVMAQLAGSNGTQALRDLTIEDLLGRPPREVDEAACRSLIAGKVVLVTGAAGSIGSELCRQVALYAPARVLALDRDETGLYNLGLELGGDAPLDLLIGDVSDKERLEAIWRQHRPAVVFHCAAYKHVPMLEQCPTEAVKTNVVGTLVPAALSQEYGTAHFIFVSTDKAACPINVLGASKRVGELLMMAMQDPEHGSTRFSVVRFGNVLGSRGSVVPTFARQIDRGGPVTITHRHMERFFMSVQEAVSLVIQAGAYTTGGDLFVLDMGEQVRIEEVARKVIRLRGLRVGRDIHIAFTGVRPGEKLSEILSCPICEVLEPTHHSSILRVQNYHDLPRGDLVSGVDRMVRLAKQGLEDTDQLRAMLLDVARLPCPADCDRPECV